MIDTHLDTPIGSPGKIRTSTGRLVDPFDLKPEHVLIEDIAHSLSHQCRFTGHTRWFYSVAEHCLLVCGLLSRFDPKIRMGGLLHEGGEVYLGDMAGPSKRRGCMADYDRAEHRAGAVVMQKYVGELTEREHQLIKQADGDAYRYERNVLMRPGPDERYLSNEVDVHYLGQLPPTEIKELFLYMFDYLNNQLKGS